MGVLKCIGSEFSVQSSQAEVMTEANKWIEFRVNVAYHWQLKKCGPPIKAIEEVNELLIN